MVNMELTASYTCLSMAHYFRRDDVPLQKFLKKQSNEGNEYAQELMKYQRKRGQHVSLQDIKKPEKDEWAVAALLDLHKMKMDDYITNLNKIGATSSGLPECLFDKLSLKESRLLTPSSKISSFPAPPCIYSAADCQEIK
uniref:Ferritin/DPS domain-containing protein n=1 Tax=Erpetoichthys calabaricus TaxID=27687 RepID=A0A8C4SKX6_ERPCA